MKITIYGATAAFCNGDLSTLGTLEKLDVLQG
jgi:hypothetical protein